MSTERHTSEPQPLPSGDRSSDVVSIEAAFSGPLPLPGLLAKYNEIIPSGAERIMAMAEGKVPIVNSLKRKPFAPTSHGKLVVRTSRSFLRL